MAPEVDRLRKPQPGKREKVQEKQTVPARSRSSSNWARSTLGCRVADPQKGDRGLVDSFWAEVKGGRLKIGTPNSSLGVGESHEVPSWLT